MRHGPSSAPCHPGIYCRDPSLPDLDGPLGCGAVQHISTFRTRGLMGPGHEARDDICGWGMASHSTNTTALAAHGTRGFASSSVSPTGAERRGPYRYKLGDAALAAPRTTTGPPAASPRSSMPGGEPAYADRRQQGGTDSLMSRAAVVAPGSNRRQPALVCALGSQIRDRHKIRSRRRAGITFPD